MDNLPAAHNTLDQQVNTEWMRIAKCIIPYLDRPMQKNLAISLKVFELMSVMQLYNKESEVEPVPMQRGGGWEKQLLNDIKSNVSPDKAYMIDALTKMQEVKSLLAYKNPEDTPLDQIKTTGEPDFNRPLETSQPQDSSGQSKTQAPGPNGADIIEKLSPLLDDNQRQMLKLFSTFMK